MKISKVISWGCVCGLSLAASAVRADLVFNGNFNNQTTAGWTVTPASSIFTAGGNFAHGGTGDGVAFGPPIQGVGTAPDVLSQVLTTVAGQSYTLTFWLNENPLNSNPGGTLEFSANFGSDTVLDLNPMPNTVGYQEFSYNVTASGTSTTLSFTAKFADFDYQPGLDDVSVVPNVAAVPEPSTILAGAFMAIPFGIAGLRRISRRK